MYAYRLNTTIETTPTIGTYYYNNNNLYLYYFFGQESLSQLSEKNKKILKNINSQDWDVQCDMYTMQHNNKGTWADTSKSIGMWVNWGEWVKLWEKINNK